jgi:hypothetical protein
MDHFEIVDVGTWEEEAADVAREPDGPAGCAPDALDLRGVRSGEGVAQDRQAIADRESKRVGGSQENSDPSGSAS